MASWLRNVQEKLENVASSIDRVVQEAASEVTMNPEVEIEVEKQKCSEAERQLLIEQKKSDDLQKRVEELEEQLYSTNIENDAIKERFQQMISARDEQIKRYERELEHLRNWQPQDEDDSDDKLTRLKEENAKLRKEIAEWKKVARESSPGSSDTTKIKELQDEIRRLKEKHTEELADITYSNQQMIAEVRQEYESLVQKIKENHSPVPHLSHKNETFKINEEFMRSMSVSLDEIKEENVQLTGQIQELEERIYNLMHRLEKQKTPIPQNAEIQTEFENTSSEKEVELNHEIERLKAINAEMAVAYNDLNSEFETHKTEHGTVMHANSDLVARIDALKASLIEYEERYELCKGEHMKTVSQLEKLTADFERLRSNFQITKRSSDQNEEKMSQEMLQLKEALEKTKTDRDNFRTEVKSFRDSVSSISSELDRLRDNNRKVMEDNVKLAESLSRHESVHEMLKESNEELARFRESLTALQQEHKEKINHLESEKAELEERILELEDQLNASTNWETTDASFSANTTQTEALSQSFTANTQTELEIFEPRQKEVLEEEIKRDVQLEKYKTMVESTLGSSTTEVVDLEASLHKGHKKLRNMSETESSNNGSQSGWDKIESEQFAEAAISESSGSETSISASKVFPDSCVEAQISPSQVSPTVSSTSTNEETHDEAKEAQITELKIKISDLEQQWNRLNEEAAEKEKNLKTSSFALLDIQHILQNLGAELDENLHKENETHESPDLLLLRQVGILQEQIEKIPRIMDEENKQKMDYYKQLEELNSVNEELISRLEKIQTELDAKNGVLAKATNEKETIGKELEFLRDHVKTMEEVTNREVLAFEEKEAELLEKIRVLDGKIQTDNQNFSQVQTQYQQQLSELQSKLAGFELENKHFHEESTHNENNRNEIENMKTNLSSLAQENYQLLQEVTRKDKTLETILTSLKNLQQLLHNLGASSIYEEEVLEENAEIDLVIERYLAGLHEQIEKLQKIVYDKHKESVEYYNKMQEFSSSYENQSKQLVSIQEQLAQSNTKLAMSYEEKEKAAKELGRLREHLLQMEDMSTKEAIAAEERETELRKRIRELEERSSAVSDTVVQSENFYQQQVSELSARLSTLEDEYMKLQERVLEKEKSLTDTSKSLSNLQLVLRDLGADHEKEIKQYDDDLDMLKEELNHLTKELEEFKTREAQLIENRRFHEDTVALLKEEIARKEKVIDELENQLEESNPVSSTQSVTSLASGATHGTTSTYKIDDVTLRSLFLSYLTADRDKQPEIAMVMSSILGYTQDEQGRIQKSLLSGDRSWFSFIRSSIHQPGTANANVASLTEQFVRFLEQESRVAHQHATLPVQSDSNTAIELNEPISSSETKPYDLKSILEDTEANEASA
uniref:GRIP domain-containing protein n=1 Tax=Acrobeloides nanus TaxID=290746 RepID=A0A914BUQ8_9BILA